jgi:hypothetical protein
MFYPSYSSLSYINKHAYMSQTVQDRKAKKVFLFRTEKREVKTSVC